MPEHFVYRLVVDHWPTPDGEPFTDQSPEFWEQVVDDYANGVGPAWLPADLSPYGESALDPANYTHWVGDPGEPDVGWSGSTLIHVPIAPTRRFFSRGPVVAMAKQLREWGCRAHVERAPVGDWESLDGS
jgi:hypothetical protein